MKKQTLLFRISFLIIILFLGLNEIIYSQENGPTSTSSLSQIQSYLFNNPAEG